MQRIGVAVCLVAALALGAAPGARAAAAGVAPRGADPVAFELDEVLDGSFSARGVSGVWVSGSQLARRTSLGNIEVFNVDNNSTSILVASTVLASRNTNVGTWTLSSDQSKLLWSHDVKAGFRHSTEAKYAVYDITNEIWRPLHEEQHLQIATLAPSGDGVAYVIDNNVYHVENIIESVVGKAITGDGSTNVYNGVPDWVYEEEVLSSGSAMWFSPNGSYLVHAKFNDTKVEAFNYIIYGTEEYTNVESLLYPKAGTENPTVVLSVTKVPENVTIVLPLPGIGEDILQNVAWAGNEMILVTWLNRTQNHVVINSYKLVGGTTPATTTLQISTVFEDFEATGWLDVGTPRAISETSWVMLLPQKLAGEDQRFMRPVVFQNSQNTSVVAANLTATALYGWDTVRNRIFFQAAPGTSPGQRHVYASTIATTPVLQCLSCSLQQRYGGEACLYASASFSTDFSRASFTCSGPGPAATRLGILGTGTSLTLTWSHYLEDNADLVAKLNERKLPTVVANITVPVEGGIIAQARMWLPPDLDESKKYPMLVYVYGGPGSQQVNEAFSVSYGYHLATKYNIIYAAIDGRGSGQQGSKTLYALYRKLGTVEVEDQISVTQELVKRYSYIDPDLVGIWGWSYGGYATAMAMALDKDNVFACGASVAPVTSWDLYDTIYTERYMSTPIDNPTGYRNANVSNKVDNFKTHEFYLLHGNADDNVHYQQAMRLARALEESNIFFETQSYPDENHSIRSVIQHVYMSLTVFFNRCYEARSSSAPVVGLPALLPALLFPLLARIFA